MTNEEMAQLLDIESMYHSNHGDSVPSALRAGAAALRALEWRQWPDESNEGEYPPDEQPVLIYCGNWASKDLVIGRISKRCGTYGPSGATHWLPIPAPPPAEVIPGTREALGGRKEVGDA